MFNTYTKKSILLLLEKNTRLFKWFFKSRLISQAQLPQQNKKKKAIKKACINLSGLSHMFYMIEVA